MSATANIHKAILILSITFLAAAAQMGEAAVGSPGGVVVLSPRFHVEEVALVDGSGNPLALDHPTSLAFRGDELLVIEGGRYHYAAPFQPHLAQGRLVSFSLSGGTAVATPLLEGLDDPLGLAVGLDGAIYFTQYGRISRLGPEGILQEHTVGLPPQVADFPYAPVLPDDSALDVLRSVGQGDLIDVNTTGTMGLAFDADGTLYATQSANGPPPDDPFLGTRSYGVDYSSSVLTPFPGAAHESMVYARGCRNCYDLAVAPEGTPHAGQVFATENVGIYRLRAQAGQHRTAFEGSSLLDGNHADGVVVATPGQVRRVAVIPPDSITLGAAPTGIAFAPASFPAGTPSRIFIAVYGGLPESFPQDGADDRGFIATVEPEPVTGAGPVVPFAVGLDFPTDLAFGPDGALYVVEYFSGRLFRIVPGA